VHDDDVVRVDRLRDEVADAPRAPRAAGGGVVA